MELSYFFNEVQPGDREYNADDFAKYFRDFLSDGVYKHKDKPNLQVTANGSNMNTYVGIGSAFVLGYRYENNGLLTMKHDAAEATLDRIDRVVLRLDKSAENRYVRVFVKKGTASSSPVEPGLQRDEFVYEISLATVRIIAGRSFILQTQITDDREYVVMLEEMYALKSQALIGNGEKVQVGTAILNPGTTSVNVTLPEAFSSAPIVFLGLKSLSGQYRNYYTYGETATGFIIAFNQEFQNTSGVRFWWLAVGQ